MDMKFRVRIEYGYRNNHPTGYDYEFRYEIISDYSSVSDYFGYGY